MQGIEGILGRCGELAWLDMTHHRTKYDYLLTSFVIADYEEESREALFNLQTFTNFFLGGARLSVAKCGIYG